MLNGADIANQVYDSVEWSMNSNFKVSIIIPVYNVERYLRDCLESCVNQSLDEIEVLVIDDCSTDSSPKIISEFQEKYPQKIKTFKTPFNSRQGAARNIGIKNARGEYLCFVDGDDYIAQNMCEELYNIAVSESSEEVFCDGYMCSGEKKDYFVQVDDWIVNNKLLNKFTSQCYQIIKKSVIIDNELYFPEHIFCEDTAVTPLWLLCANNALKVNEPYYYQVKHNDSTSSMMYKTGAEDIMKALEILISNSKRIGLYEKNKAKIDSFIFNRMIRYADTIISEEYLPDEAEQNAVKAVWSNYKFDTTLFKNYFTFEKVHLVEQCFSMTIINSDDTYLCDNNPEMIKALKQYDGTIVIAGAGEKGVELAKIFFDNRIAYSVCDSDTNKIGTKMKETGDIIQSVEQVKEKENPLFLVSARAYFESIKETLNYRDDKIIDFWQMLERMEFNRIGGKENK